MENREIKFRGKQKSWIYGGYACVHGRHLIINENGEFEVNGKSVGQYVGLKDKHGKDIYERDIVKTGTDKLMVVSWNKRFASFCIDRDGWAFSHWFGEAFESTEGEIIGNTFDNPELIK